MYTKGQQNIIFFIFIYLFLNTEFDGFLISTWKYICDNFEEINKKIETFDFIAIIDFKLHIIIDIIDLTILP